MAEAALQTTLVFYKLRRNALQLEISQLESQKAMGTLSQADRYSLKTRQENEVKAYFKDLYECDCDINSEYRDYTEIPDFKEAIAKITAQFEEEQNDLTAWETAIDSQITTDSAELEEINAYMESISNMLSSNIQDDYNYGLNG